MLWTIISQPVGSSAIIDNPNSLVSSVSGTLVSGTYVFELSIECTDNITASDQVTHTILDGPGTAWVSTSMSAGCYSGSGIAISGNAPGTGETVSWRISSGEGSLTNASSQTVTFFPNEKKYTCKEGSNGYEAVLTYTKTKNGCTSSDDIIVSYTFAEEPFFVETIPTFTCGLCTDLYGACNLDGTGTWTYTGPGTASFTSGASSANTEVCVDVAGDYTFTWTVSGGCRTGTDDVAVTFNDIGGEPLAADAGTGEGWCTFPSTIVLNAAPVSGGQTGVWTQVDGSTATITTPSSASTTVTGIVSGGGPYTFAWTVSPDGGGICTVSDTVSFYERPEWDFYPITDYGCPNFHYSWENYFLITDPYPLDGFDSVQISILFHEAPDDYSDSVFFSLSYAERENPSDNSGSGYSLAYDTAVVGVPVYLTVSRDSILSKITAWARDEDYFSLTAHLLGNNGNYPSGYYDYEITILDDCASYPYERSFNYSAKNGFDTPNAGTDIVLSCGATTTGLAGTGMYIASPENHRALWSMISGPGANPLTDASSRQTNPVLTGLVPGTYVFRYTSDFGPDCEPVYDDMRVIVSASPATISSMSIVDPSFCGTGPIEIKALYSNDVHPDSVSWSMISPSPTSEVLSDTSETDSSILTITDLLPSTNYTIQVRVANACGAATQTINFSTGSSTGPTKAEILTDNTCSSSGLVTLSAATVSSGTGTWSIISEPPGSLASIADPSANPTTITGFTNLPEGRWVIQWEVSNAPSCATTSTDTMIIARGTLDMPDAGPDWDACGVSLPYSSSLQAEPITASEAANLIYGEWRFYSGPSYPTISNKYSPTSAITFDAYGEYVLGWASTSGISCLEELDIVHITIGEGAPGAFAGTDQSRCGGSNVFTLDAFDLGVGENGSWSVASTTGTASVSFADATDPNTDATITGVGEVELRWSTFSNTNGCPANADYMTISYTASPVAGDDQTLCASTSTLLRGNDFSALSGATVAWTRVSGPNTPTIVAPSDYQTAITDLITGTYVFRYSLTDGACSLSDDITVTVTGLPTVDAGDDFVFCDGETITLSGNTPSTGTTAWERVIGENSGTFSAASSPSTTYGSISQNSDLYLFSYTVSDGACAIYDYVEGHRLRNESLSIASSDPTCGNTDGSADLTVAGNDGSLSFLWSDASTGEDLSGVAAGIYTVTVSHPSGCSADATVELLNADGPQVSSADPTICPNNETTITPTYTGGTAPYTYLWSSGETTPGTLVRLSGDSTLSMTLTDDVGCSNPIEIPVATHTVATLSLGNDVMNCDGGDVTLIPQLSSKTYGSAFYSEDFETDLGIWAQAADDDYDWMRDGFGTPSSSTGPSSGDGDTYYLFAEASSRSNMQYVLTSAAFDLSGRTGTGFSFSYHMYGSFMGSLEVLASTDSSDWISLWSLSGDQGDSWFQETLDLSVYDGISTVYLRFRGTIGSGYASDMAIDNVSLAEGQESYLWNTFATTSTLTVNPIVDTDYYVDVTDANSCVLTDTVTVFVDCVFPVEWLEFTVKQVGVDAQLSWSTAQEINSDRFVIERSTDKALFQAVGEVAAAGNSQDAQSYRYTDHKITTLSSSVLYYRLRQIDLDGQFDYSEMEEIRLSDTQSFSLLAYPNPADQLVQVRFEMTGSRTKQALIQVYSSLGQVMHQVQIPPNQEFGELQIDVHNWAEGPYYIQMLDEERTQVVKLWVR